MNKIKYKIFIPKGIYTGDERIREVEGYAIEIEGFNEFRFGVHQSDAQKTWAVSELSTGLKLAGGKTRREAVEAARNILSNLTAKKLKTIIGKNMEIHGGEISFPVNC